MKTIILDFTNIFTREQLHAYLKKQFDFPDYYGRNLDALYDLLTEIMEETEIRFDWDEDNDSTVWPAEDFLHQEELRRYLRKTRRVIEDAAEENKNLHL